jgi:Xaa-Pro dipeptidase
MTELEEKTERLTRLAAVANVGGVILNSQAGFSWLTGGGSNRIDGSRENGNGALFVRADGRRFVLANAIEMPRLVSEELAGADWLPVEYPWPEEHARAETVVTLAASLTTGGMSIGADTALPGAVVLDRGIARARAPLTRAEVPRYRALARDAGVVAGETLRSVSPGTTEHEVARRMSDAALAIGGRAIVLLVAADERIALFRHPVPTMRAWQHTLMVAACIQRQGLVVALSRILVAGPVPPALAERTEKTAQVFSRLLDATRAGTGGSDLFEVARRAYAEVGFAGEETRHHQGGAIGYRSREWVAHPASEEVVQTVQAFAWNPSITGTKVEETALLDDDRIELITSTPGWPTITGGASGILKL